MKIIKFEMILDFGRKIIPKSIFNFCQPIYHYLLSLIGSIFYMFPSMHLNVIGVTGSKGKSSVVYLASKIFEHAGLNVGASSTIQWKINKEEKDNDKKLTMPGRFFIQSFLAKCWKKACKYAILEVSSEGIKQYRHKFIKFNTVIFTNLEPEHIEAHGSFAKYRDTKLKLFNSWGVKNIIVNLDDENAELFLGINKKAKKIGYSLKIQDEYVNKDLQFIIRPTKIISLNPVEFEIDNFYFKTNLFGEYNLSNILAVLALAKLNNISLGVSRETLQNLEKIPGRFEFIDIKKNFKVIIDYAHTPVSLEKTYQTTKNLINRQGDIICVLGAAGGGRDKWKRPVLGKIAAFYCQKIILTNEDPYDEDPQDIINQIKTGILEHKKFELSNLFEILDRRQAIKKALEIAKNGDIVVITGKGNEKFMMLENNRKINWSDRQIVLEESKNL